MRHRRFLILRDGARIYALDLVEQFAEQEEPGRNVRGRVLLQRVAQRQDRGLLRQGRGCGAAPGREAQHGQQHQHKHQHVQTDGRRLEAVRQGEAREGRPRAVGVAEVPVVPARRGVARERRVRVLDLAERLGITALVWMCGPRQRAVGLLDDGRVGG